MIPFIPLQYFSFKTNLTTEQAISILGRSIPLKREIRKNNEVVSFKYQPYRVVKYQSMGTVKVYVKYLSEPDGVRVNVTVIPTIMTMLLFACGFGFILLSDRLSPDFSNETFFILLWLFFYLFNWWETVDTRKAVRNMFRDSIIK